MPNSRYNSQASPAKPKPGPAAGQPPGYNQSPGTLIDMSAKDRRKLKELCQQAIDHWQGSTPDHMEDLRRWNDMTEMVVEETDWPWPDASNVTLGLAAIHLHSLHSVICRSMTTVSPLWFGRTELQNARANIPAVEDMLDYVAKSKLNTVSAVRQVVYAAGRDSIAHTKTYWKETRELICDVVVCDTPADFTDQFPTPESCGMTKETYDAKVKEIRLATSQKNAGLYEVPIECEVLTYQGPWTDVIEEANWVQAPANAPELEDCWAYGHIYDENRSNLMRRAKNGELYQDAVDLFARQNVKSETSAWKKALESIEGITNKSSNKAWDFSLYELVIRYDMDGDGLDEKYVCQYSKDKDVLLGVMRYYWPCEIYQQWRFLRKTGRRLGLSVPGAIESVSNKADDIFNRDENSADVDSVPMFITTNATKKTLDDGGFSDGTFFKPGGLLATENGSKDLEAIKVPPSDKTTSQSRRAELIGYAEMILGPTAMISGKQSPIDPEAPGNKTIALIQQSNMRIEDYISELRLSFDKLGDIMLVLYRRQGPDEVVFESGRGADRELATLRRTAMQGVNMTTHGVTPLENPWIELQKAEKWLMLLGKDPMIMQDPIRHRALLEMVMISGRLQNRQEMLPSKEEVTGELDKQREAAVKEKVMGQLVAKGLIPPPGGLPGLPPAAVAPGLPPPIPIPGAGPGAPGLPSPANLPAPVAV